MKTVDPYTVVITDTVRHCPCVEPSYRTHESVAR